MRSKTIVREHHNKALAVPVEIISFIPSNSIEDEIASPPTIESPLRRYDADAVRSKSIGKVGRGSPFRLIQNSITDISNHPNQKHDGYGRTKTLKANELHSQKTWNIPEQPPSATLYNISNPNEIFLPDIKDKHFITNNYD